ncbi:MAG: hypothetical protein EOO11_01250 [Chitinophagaceae bacterium]|nr:MAG: hypothetical protein EOO11_01250 [Chitinophagaceae bacterium]
MKKGLFPKLLPHLVAFIVFLLVAIIYCSPALEGMVVNQSDVTHWKGMNHQSELFKEQHGQYPLWTNSMFSGMPTFQIAYPANNVVPWLVHGILTLHLPVPIQFFFLACICFYFLCCVLRVNPYIGIFGALSFAYATYNPIIISVGHDTKMWSIAYMPAVLGSILLIFDRRYWLGAGLTALFTSVLIAMNHPQIDYYLFIVLGIMTLFFAARWVMQKQYIHLFKALGLTLVAGVIGVLVNAVTILSTYEYQKETIRGGASELARPGEGDAENGLSKKYAFSYSMAIPEPLVMAVPRMYGGSSSQDERGEAAAAPQALNSVPPQLVQQAGLQYFMKYYWGGIGGTSGPPYSGAVVVFLALLSLFVLDNRHKWWAWTAILVAVVMSWGSYFDGFNSLLYHYLPMYNKFRAPSMILVIPQLLLPLLAALTLDQCTRMDHATAWPKLKKGLLATAGFFALLLLCSATFKYLSDTDQSLLRDVRATNNVQITQPITEFFDALRDDRKSMFLGDIFRTFLFMAFGFGLLFLALRKTIGTTVAGVAFAALSLIDLMPVASRYLNKENYQEKEDNQSVFALNETDQQILSDKSHFRVYNEAGDAFTDAITSYNYNSVGGYHAVKLRIYQDLIDNQLQRQVAGNGVLPPNPQVLRMLNTKYYLRKDPSSGTTMGVRRDDSACGPAWFVRNLATVKDASAEMRALDNFDPRATAFVREANRPAAGNGTVFSGEGTVTLLKNENDVITYKTSSPAPQFAVFSEVYYAAGWKAFIDDKELSIARVNYVLRGLPVPAGDHTITFRFEPPAYVKGHGITSIFTVLLLLLLAAGIFLEWRARHRAPVTPA